MKDFVTYDVRSSLSKSRIFELVTRSFPGFRWRQGDSDSQGPYISGMDPDDLQIKLWLGESPIKISISFDDVWVDQPDRETRKAEMIENFEKSVIDLLGWVTKKDA